MKNIHILVVLCTISVVFFIQCQKEKQNKQHPASSKAYFIESCFCRRLSARFLVIPITDKKFNFYKDSDWDGWADYSGRGYYDEYDWAKIVEQSALSLHKFRMDSIYQAVVKN